MSKNTCQGNKEGGELGFHPSRRHLPRFVVFDRNSTSPTSSICCSLVSPFVSFS
jgi:hypothetical protein